MADTRTLEKRDIETVIEDGSHVEHKPQVIEIGNFRVIGLDPDDADFFINYPEEKRKKIFRKVLNYQCHPA